MFESAITWLIDISKSKLNQVWQYVQYWAMSLNID